MRPGSAHPRCRDPIGETNDFGQFRIHGVPPGRYQLHTQPALEPLYGFDPEPPDARRQALDSMTDAQKPKSTLVQADAVGGQETTVVLRHSAPAVEGVFEATGGALTGVVSDEQGEPLDGISVSVWQVELEGGRRQASPAVRAQLTDDRGRFRLFHIRPGRYVVVATDGRWRLDGPEGSEHLPVFYPGRTSITDAFEVDVPRGQTLDGMDMVFSWTRGVRVHGFVTSTAAAPAEQFVRLARSVRSGDIAPLDRTTLPRADGSFEFRNVAAGEHVVRVTRASAQAPQLIAEYTMQYVRVGTVDEGPIVLTATPTSTISGRVRLEGNAAELNPTRLVLTAIPSDPDSAPTMAVGARTTIRPDWTFEIGNLAGAMRIAFTSGPPGWWIKSVDMGGANAAQQPVMFGRPGDSRDDVTIVLSSAVGQLSGRVLDGTRRVEDGWVAVFAVDDDRWFSGSPYLRMASRAQDGRYSVQSLPPGDYWVIAVDDNVSGMWQDRDVMNGLLADARRTTIDEGGRATLDLPLVRLPR